MSPILKMESRNLIKTKIRTSVSHGSNLSLVMFLVMFLIMLLVLSMSACAPEDKKDNNLNKSNKKSDRSSSEDSAEKLFFSAPKRTLEEAKKRYLKPSPKKENWRLYVKAAKKADRDDDYNSAILLASEAIKLNPKSAAAYSYRAQAKFDSLEGDDSNVMADLEKAVELGTKSDDTYSMLARMYDKAGKPQKAVDALTKGISAAKYPKQLYRVRASLYCAMEENEKAIADYDYLIKQNPRYARIYAHRGQLHESMGHNEKALSDYKNASIYDHQRSAVRVKPIALNLRADLLTKLGRPKEAITDLNELIKASPGEDETLRKRGDCYTALKDYSKALADYNKAIALEPKFARPVYESRSKLYKKMGKDELAQKDIETAHKMKTAPAEKKLY